MGTVIWISWEWHRRAKEITSALGVDWIVLESDQARIVRYALNVWHTFWEIHSRRPSCLIVQNPSIVLAALSCMLRPLYRYYLIVDAHNAAIHPENSLLKRCRPLLEYCLRKADLTIVTNEALARIVRKSGGRYFVLPDRIPSVPRIERMHLNGKFNIAYICTFKEDEPVEAVVEAATQCGPEICLFITGDKKKCPSSLRQSISDNIQLTGFLPEERYWSLLASVDLVIDLTTREGCLVCGAYEAIALGKTVILSDTEAQRTIFSKGVLFTRNTPEAIAQAIKIGIMGKNELEISVRDLGEDLADKWERLSRSLLQDHILTGPQV